MKVAINSVIKTSKTFRFPRGYQALLKRLAYSEEYHKLSYNSDRRDWVLKIVSARKWSSKDKERGVSAWMPLYVSPCGKFLIKYCYMARNGRQPIPAEHMVPTVYAGWKPGSGEYAWCLQPMADISSNAARRAAEHFVNNGVRRLYDAHDGNCGMYEGRPVLFDW